MGQLQPQPHPKITTADDSCQIRFSGLKIQNGDCTREGASPPHIYTDQLPTYTVFPYSVASIEPISTHNEQQPDHIWLSCAALLYRAMLAHE